MVLASPFRIALALATLVACAPDPASTCYAPAAYSYRAEVRRVGTLPGILESVLALPDGRAVAVIIDGSLAGKNMFRAFMIDPASDAIDEVVAWEGGIGPLIRLADGRLLKFDNSDCGYVFIDLDASGEVTPRTCDVDSFNVDILWQDPAGQVFMFGEHYPGGNRREGAAFTLDLESAEVTLLGDRVEHSFRTPPDQPFPLCDGRLVFPHTEIDGGDFTADAEAMHDFDPATRELTSFALPFAPAHAAQLDASTALLFAFGPDFAPEFHLMDLETRDSRAIDPPSGLLVERGAEPLIALVDGRALVVGLTGEISTFSPADETWTASGAQFSSGAERLLRLATGPVLAFVDEGGVEIYE